jgi:homocysteine S-methyltransferase
LSVGINCTKPEYITSLLQRLETSLPKIAYPNAGRTWDAINRSWLDAGTDEIPSSELSSWIDAGARILGGCCGLAEKQIEAVRRQVS